MTLLETLLVILFLTAITLGLMQLASSALIGYARVAGQWKTTMNRWNDGRAIRAGSGSHSASEYVPFPGARPLRRHVLVSGGRRWEILRADK